MSEKLSRTLRALVFPIFGGVVLLVFALFLWEVANGQLDF